MYTETVKSDIRDFFRVIAVTAVCVAIVWILRCFIKNTLISDIITFAVIGYAAYKTLTGCCGEFTYSVNSESVVLSRRISSVNKHITINKSDITGIYLSKPEKSNLTLSFCRPFGRSGRCYITYRDEETEKTAVFEPSEDFRKNMSELGYSL